MIFHLGGEERGVRKVDKYAGRICARSCLLVALVYKTSKHYIEGIHIRRIEPVTPTITTLLN